MNTPRKGAVRIPQEIRAEYDAMLPGQQEITLRLIEISNLVLKTMSDTFRFYLDLEPDGRLLSAQERTAARERLEIGALCLRDADENRELVRYSAAKEGFDFRPSISILRIMQRSLILALSEDSTRRGRAISLRELRALMRPIHEFWASKKA